ncbi:MAG: beta-ketoacyl-[acyl-carrier-protein] synthase family protein [Proteobacteria bacterium]|nr:beta-ketoacyl-[acyl-carrier-protein] synthase family protein [Pseudomonadota bacterium]MBU1715703.1 beta-ketoacyl-[acyl-carrier-protein] synthase family protein [Pseudomonadota bacterium]
MPLNRVVITGRGAVSPFGPGVKVLSDSVRHGMSGVRIMDDWRRIGGLYSYLAAPVPALDPKDYLPRVIRRSMGDMALHAAIAAREAVDDAKISDHHLASGRTGVVIGSTTGSPETYENFYRMFLPQESMEEVKSGFFFRIMGHSCAANVCLALGINGEQWAPASACTSAAQALGLGYLLIKSGRQDIVLCGGADETHHTVTMVFDILKAASRCHDAPLATPRPFDVHRDGVVCGAGSGILALESLDSALARKAEIYCELLGFGHVTDSTHIANPHEDSMGRAMRQALDEAGLEADKIDYVNAHATGTLQGDAAEAIAIHNIVGSNVPVSSFKGHIGHTLGAAGALETVILLEMMQRQEIFPTLHLDHPDPMCGGINLVRELQSHKIDTVLKNNFALGGVNAALVLRRWQQ